MLLVRTSAYLSCQSAETRVVITLVIDYIDYLEAKFAESTHLSLPSQWNLHPRTVTLLKHSSQAHLLPVQKCTLPQALTLRFQRINTFPNTHTPYPNVLALPPVPCLTSRFGATLHPHVAHTLHGSQGPTVSQEASPATFAHFPSPTHTVTPLWTMVHHMDSPAHFAPNS